MNTQLIDSNVRVKCLGGRELRGALRGYDELVNLVLDDCEEFLRGMSMVRYVFFWVYILLTLFYVMTVHIYVFLIGYVSNIINEIYIIYS